MRDSSLNGLINSNPEMAISNEKKLLKLHHKRQNSKSNWLNQGKVTKNEI